MSNRRHTTKPSLALWTLAAVLLIVSSAGVLALIALFSVVAIGATAGYLLLRRNAATTDAVRAAVPVASRSAHRRVSA